MPNGYRSEQHKPAPKFLPGAPPVDSLPEDEESSLTGDYQLLATFPAYIRGSGINQGGELIMRLGIPFEYKYEAMPLTDERGVMFTMVVYRPLRKAEVEANNNGHQPLDEWLSTDAD